MRVFQLDMLSEVVQAVAGRCEVYMDGGVRTGTDVFKALALGARAVFVGRPVIYGLAYNVCTFHLALQAISNYNLIRICLHTYIFIYEQKEIGSSVSGLAYTAFAD